MRLADNAGLGSLLRKRSRNHRLVEFLNVGPSKCLLGGSKGNGMHAVSLLLFQESKNIVLS